MQDVLPLCARQALFVIYELRALLLEICIVLIFCFCILLSKQPEVWLHPSQEDILVLFSKRLFKVSR